MHRRGKIDSSALLREVAERETLKKKILDELSPHQRQVADYFLSGGDEPKWMCVTCGRRAGKSELDVRLIVIALIDSGANNEWVGYGAQTYEAATRIIWRPLVSLLTRLGLDKKWRIKEGSHTIEVPGRGKFHLLGFDNQKSVGKVRGNKYRLFICDEPANYDEFLREFITTVLEPTLGDLRGAFLINGTPGNKCSGYWYDVSTGIVPGYKHFGWTVRDNPFFKEPEKWLEDVREKNGYSPEEPSYLREYLGQWVDDYTVLVYAFDRNRNIIKDLPDYDPQTWKHSLGIDYGFNDPTAWVVLASPPDRREMYIIFAEKEKGLIDDEIASRTANLCQRYPITTLIGDSADSKAIEAFNRRWGPSTGRYIQRAKKFGKMAHISLINTEWRTGRLKVVSWDCRDIITELQTLPWKGTHGSSARIEHPAYDNHCTDAMLYAFIEHFIHLPASNEKRETAVGYEDDAAREKRWADFKKGQKVDHYWKTESKRYG